MHRRMKAWAGLGVAGALLLGGCGADAPSRDELVHALELTGIPSERAECAADAVLDSLSDEELTQLVQRGPAGAPRDDPDRTDDASDEVRAALAACQQVGAGSTTTSSTTTTPAGSSTSSSATDATGSSTTEPVTTAPGSQPG